MQAWLLQRLVQELLLQMQPWLLHFLLQLLLDGLQQLPCAQLKQMVQGQELLLL